MMLPLLQARLCKSKMRDLPSHPYNTWLNENCTDEERHDNGQMSYASHCGAMGTWIPREQSCRAGNNHDLCLADRDLQETNLPLRTFLPRTTDSFNRGSS